MKPLLLAPALLLAALSGDASAEGFYLLSGYGLAQIDSGLGNQSASSGSLTATVKVDTSGQGWTLGGGYQINNVLSFEGGYLNISGLGATANLTANNAVINGNTVNGTMTANQTVTGNAWYIAPRASYHTGDWDFFVKGGMAFAKVKSRFSISGAGTVNGNAISGSYVYSVTDDSTVPMLGLGAQYDLNKHFSLRGEFVWLDKIGNKDTTGASAVKLWMLSGAYRF